MSDINVRLKAEEWVIDGQEAGLIIPSEDQVKEFNNQAEVIIKYPKVLKNNGNQYYFFIMYADKNNIQSIAKTIKFID
ncbi:hypothetical protein Ana3638_22215 [Anaerocolumna sedimenticola]|uniref:Uncharacterized protein n=1 Tax=Anaerocolumna sedimenticola TaxID=2696063 RepID=A0A6P1TRR0_9FIRM|nr:hypothetical protein [Anaerocolumna sedimenticola]QHQ63153.1 hypothetical protein Ana3638_22215 [Anaerocolumna sedimenticola]